MRGKREAENGKAWELIMQMPQLRRNNNCGNSKTNRSTEGYCLAFAYVLDNYNLLIMPILFRATSLCSYNNARIRNCNGALFQFKWKLGSPSSGSPSSRSGTFGVLWTVWLTQCRKWWKDTRCKIHTSHKIHNSLYTLCFIQPEKKSYILIRIYTRFLWHFAASTFTIFCNISLKQQLLNLQIALLEAFSLVSYCNNTVTVLSAWKTWHISSPCSNGMTGSAETVPLSIPEWSATFSRAQARHAFNFLLFPLNRSKRMTT